jgi:hypothetical protein
VEWVWSVIVPASAGLDRDVPLTARLPCRALGHPCGAPRLDDHGKRR